jgi:hypothetical protein
MFISHDARQIEASAAIGAAVVELHTGLYSELLADGHAELADRELQALRKGASLAASLGLEVHAGHGLTYDNVEPIAAIPELAELNIGHFLVGEAIFRGLGPAIEEMRPTDGPGARSRRMILGIGTDLANIERIEATLARFGDRFRNRVFTEREQRKAEGRPRAVAATYAKRWAAKEACSKALGHRPSHGHQLEGHGGHKPAIRPAGHACDRLGRRTAARDDARGT